MQFPFLSVFRSVFSYYTNLFRKYSRLLRCTAMAKFTSCNCAINGVSAFGSWQISAGGSGSRVYLLHFWLICSITECMFSLISLKWSKHDVTGSSSATAHCDNSAAISFILLICLFFGVFGDIVFCNCIEYRQS